MSKTILMNMCMIEDNHGNLLVQERIQYWKGIAFPGGKIKNNESVYNSTIREVKEETGLDISNLKFCGIKDWYDEKEDKKFLIFTFKTNTYSGILTNETHEGKNFWVSKDELKNLELAEGFAEDLDLFFKDDIFEISWSYDEIKGWVDNII